MQLNIPELLSEMAALEVDLRTFANLDTDKHRGHRLRELADAIRREYMILATKRVAENEPE